MDLIQPGKLRCSETAARLIYRSTIEATGSRNASEIVGVIKEWVTSTETGEDTRPEPNVLFISPIILFCNS